MFKLNLDLKKKQPHLIVVESKIVMEDKSSALSDVVVVVRLRDNFSLYLSFFLYFIFVH